MAFPEVRVYDPNEFMTRRHPKVRSQKLVNMALMQVLVASMLFFFQLTRPSGLYVWLNLGMVALMYFTWKSMRVVSYGAIR